MSELYNNGKNVEEKESVLIFARKWGRLPSRNSNSRKEVILAQKMENYLSPKCVSYDENFRSFIFNNFPRKTNNKRAHDKGKRIEELKQFIFKFHRLPHSDSAIHGRVPGENKIRYVLDEYASPHSHSFDKALYDLIISLDPEYGNQSLPISKRIFKSQ